MSIKSHQLKTWPMYFQAIKSGEKTFEARLNDRDFKRGDVLVLQEYNPEKSMYTGQQIIKQVGFILYGPSFGVEAGHCIMSLVDFDNKLYLA